MELFKSDYRLTDEEAFAWSGEFMHDVKGEIVDDEDALKNIALRWRLDPVFYAVEKYRSTLLPYQVLILLTVADSPLEVWEFYESIIGPDAYYETPKRQLLAGSGHGLGKTRVLATIGTWHRDTHPFSKTLITAPTMNQISGQLFGEFNKLRRRAQTTALGRLFEDDWSVQSSRITHVNPDNSDWGIFSATARADSPESLQGSHAIDDDDEFGAISEIFQENEGNNGASGGMMILVEEASGVPDVVRQVLSGALSEPGARLLAAGNPTRADGWFADDLDKKDRYAIQTLDCRMSNHGTIYQIPYRDFGGNNHSLPIRGRVDPSYWEKMLADCDGDTEHDVFRVRVRGLKPLSNFQQAINAKWIDAALDRVPESSDTVRTKPLVVSLDVGLTSDKHAISARQAFNIFHVKEWLPANEPDLITLQAAREVIECVRINRAMAYEVYIIVDSNGVGRGAAEYIHEHYKLDDSVTVIFFNSGKQAIDSSRYYLHRDQMWHSAGPAFFANPRACLIHSPGVKEQLTVTQVHEDEKRKIKAETKKAIFARTKKPSGNAADSILANIYADTIINDTDESEYQGKNDVNLEEFSPYIKAHLDRYSNRNNHKNFIGGNFG